MGRYFLGNRTWISQIEGIAHIVNKLSEKFPNLGVVIDGFSLPFKFSSNSKLEKITKDETEVVKQIRKLISSKIDVYDTVGCMLYKSIVWAYASDLYIAHHGSIQHKISWTANKPGVVHTNKQLFRQPIAEFQAFWARENTVAPVYISEHHITDIAENHEKEISSAAKPWNWLSNYDCDWNIMYEEILKIALSIDRK